MKSLTILIVLLSFKLHAIGQTNPVPKGQKEIIYFIYDQNGNRLKQESVLEECIEYILLDKSKRIPIKREKPGGIYSEVTPNPTLSHVQFKTNRNQFEPDAVITLLDALGKTVSITPLNQSTTTIPMENLPQGIYYMHVSIDSKTQESFKILKY